MSTSEEEPNPYELIGVGLEATEAEIKTAYRQRSLKVHPDRVRGLAHSQEFALTFLLCRFRLYGVQ